MSHHIPNQKILNFHISKNILRPWTKPRFGHHSLLLSRDLFSRNDVIQSDDVISQLNARWPSEFVRNNFILSLSGHGKVQNLKIYFTLAPPSVYIG